MKAENLSLKVFLKASRANFLLSSLIPAAIAAGLALYRGDEAKWSLFPVILLGVGSIHLFVNLVNEYFDFKKGVDPVSEEDSVHTLASGEASSGQVLFFMLLTFAAGLGCLIVLSLHRGFSLFLLGGVGFAGGYSYTGPPLAYKYRGAGEIMILILMGPLLGSGIYLALTGQLPFVAVAASFPPGLIITAVLLSNNIRDIPKDRSAGVKTLPMITGKDKASALYSFMLAAVFIWIILMAAFTYYPPLSLLSLLFIPSAIKCSKTLKKSEGDLEDIDLKTLKLYAGINSILAFSFFPGSSIIDNRYYNKLSPLIRKKIFDFLEESCASYGREAHIKKLYSSIEDFLSRKSKMIRSILLILSWQAYSSDSTDRVISAAAGLELLHACALIHDDIVDKAEQRRGGPSMHLLLNENTGKGKELAIVTGDILYGMGLKLFMASDAELSLKYPAVDEVLRAAFITGIGEFSELIYEHKKIEDLTREHILKMYDHKSARYTFTCPMLAGSILAGAPEKDRGKIATAGRLMGTAFQIRDDIIDITVNKKGRDPYEDLVRKKKTLLMYYTYVSGHKTAKDSIREFLSLDSPGEEDCRNILKLYRKSGSIDRAEKEIADLAGEAEKILFSLSPDKRKLENLISFCRCFL